VRNIKIFCMLLLRIRSSTKHMRRHKFKPQKPVLLMAQVYSPLTNTSEMIGRFTHVKTLVELYMALKSPRNVIIFRTGAPPRGRTLLSWSAIKRPRIWWRNTSTVLIMDINVSFTFKLFIMSIPLLVVASIFIVGPVCSWCVNQFYSILSSRSLLLPTE